MLDFFISIFCIPFFIGTIALVIIGAIRKPQFTIQSHWQTFLDGFAIPSRDFYASVKAELTERQIPNVSFFEQSFLERHLMSDKRLYLGIRQREFIYFVCCAPYGTGVFISSWLTVTETTFINHIPIISKLFGLDRDRKTFYQRDAEAMFRLAVHTTVTDAVDGLTKAKGIRGLSELEKQIR